jgi:subtilisin-like proprotein convertase family protein
MRLNSLLPIIVGTLLCTNLPAQTFNGTAPLPVPPGAPAQSVGITQSPASVSGVGVLGGCVVIESVTIDLLHSWTGDIGILLVAPNGTFLDLSTGNGLSGNDYSVTTFSDAAGSFITSGTPPYNGTFRPEGRATTLNNPYANTNPLGTFTFANTFNGVNADGNWTLYINDYVSADIGTLLSWSITFSTAGGAPTANAGPDRVICPGQTATLNGSGGGTYAWSSGATTATTTVSPAVTTTYTVTVTAGSCGTDTDEVLVTVQDLPTVTVSAANTEVCAGECQFVTATFTGTPPFSFVWRLEPDNINQTLSTPTNTITFAACPLTPSGQAQVLICSITDAFCTNN